MKNREKKTLRQASNRGMHSLKREELEGQGGPLHLAGRIALVAFK